MKPYLSQSVFASRPDTYYEVIYRSSINYARCLFERFFLGQNKGETQVVLNLFQVLMHQNNSPL